MINSGRKALTGCFISILLDFFMLQNHYMLPQFTLLTHNHSYKTHIFDQRGCGSWSIPNSMFEDLS